VANLEFSPQDIENLAQKLGRLQPSLSQQEHMLLLAIFAAAADRAVVSDAAGTATLPVPEIWGQVPGAGGKQATLGDLQEQLINAYVPGNYFDSVTAVNEKIVGLR
jgi:hypothetical protein